jgi:hypothetical protein
VAFDPEGGEPADPKQPHALYGDRLFFDDQVGSVKRKLIRSSVVDDLRQRLTKLGENHRAR